MELNFRVPKLGEYAVRYGTSVALLVICGIVSLLTLSDQYPVGEAAARQVARQLSGEVSGAGHVLIVTRDNQDERDFSDALQRELEAAGGEVTVVNGTPQDARRTLKELEQQHVALASVAGTVSTANWPVISELSSSFPTFSDVTIVHPSPYTWPTFLRADNLLNVANRIAVIAIVAVGMTFVIIAGGIDLSVGSLIALSSVVAGVLIRDVGGGVEAGRMAQIGGSLAGIALGGLVGAFSGGMVILMAIPPFIVTLAMMMVASGAAFLLADGNSIPELPASYTWLGRGADLVGVPNAVILMAATYIIAHVVLSKTVLGRHIYAVGDNRQAAWLSGIPVRRVVLLTYVVCGLLAGVGGIVVASTYQSGDPRYGIMYELYVIAAVVVGGTSLTGGRGTVVGTLIGAFVIGVIENAMNLEKVSPYLQKVILGLVILAAVMLDQLKDHPPRQLAASVLRSLKRGH